MALIRHPAALEEDCRLADIVIAPFTVGKKMPCRAGDRRPAHAERAGAHALYIEGLSIRTEIVAELRGRRPWVPERRLMHGWTLAVKATTERPTRRTNPDR